MSSIEEDEFDVAGHDSAPQGVHRRPRSLARFLLPIVAVLIIAPLLAWGAIALLGRTDAPIPAPTPEPEATETTDEPEDDPDELDEELDDEPEESEPTEVEPEPAEDPEDELTDPDDDELTDPEDSDVPEDEEPAAADVDFLAGVAVLNGTTVGGLATEATQSLVTSGFTGATAGNYSSPQPAVSAVYYRDATLQATAAEVADVLGIAPVQELPGASAEIVVVLRDDFGG